MTGQAQKTSIKFNVEGAVSAGSAKRECCERVKARMSQEQCFMMFPLKVFLIQNVKKEER